MISKIKNAVMAIALLFAFAAPVAAPAVVSAQANIGGSLNCGAELNVRSTTGCATPTTGTTGLQNILTRAVNIFSIIVGIIAVIMIIVGGLKYITSGGDSGNVSSAKNTILYAIVGLIVVALAQFIVRFVLNTTSGL
ncbi:MAG TPA: pilin [Candidatus Limnocylindrales bacterium]|nr:pilin [Candidatus Limnocylindrales bacterium]